MKIRIKEIRREAGLSQEAFGKRLNLSKNFINLLESGGRNPSDRTIVDICREFNVNESWLRDGVGDMYNTPPVDELEAVLEKYGLPRELRGLFLGYLELSDSAKEEVRDLILRWVSDVRTDPTVIPAMAPAETEEERDARIAREVDAEVEEYRALRTEEKRRNEIQAASQDGTGQNSSSFGGNTA